MKIESRADSAAVVIDGIGQAIKRRREKLGLTVAELAREVHVSRTTLHDLEEGRTHPRAPTLMRITGGLEAAEEESGVTQVAPSEEPDELKTFTFEVEGEAGIKVTVQGPATDHETLRADVIAIIQALRDEQQSTE